MTPLETALIGFLASLAGFTGWIIRDRIGDLKTQRDEAIRGWREQTEATKELTATVKEAIKG